MDAPSVVVVALAVVIAVAAVALAVVVRQRDRARAGAALTDPLTGLGNRRALAEAVGPPLAAGRSVALLLLDLDGFKEVNDTLGHAAGDELLVQVAAALQATADGRATVTRLGGDEFAVVVAEPESDAAVEVFAKRMLAALSVGSFTAGTVQLDLQGSIGTAVAPTDGTDLGELLQHADVAMYAAKRAGLGVLRYDSAADPHRAGGLELLGQLRGAMAEDELVLHFQPKVAGDDGRLVGFEALLRWQHPQRGLLPPADFLPLVERTNLIHALNRWVLITALQQAARWRAQGVSVPMAVNVSAVSIEEGLLGIVEEALALSRSSAGDLVVEITETAIIADSDRARRTIDALRARGVRVSVDDFGAGYTSLGHLRHLAVHELKIDRQFVSDLTDDPDDDVMVTTLITLGHRLGLTVVAEGVETAVTAARLAVLGCDELQGYHFARPMPPAQALAWARAASRLDELRPSPM